MATDYEAAVEVRDAIKTLEVTSDVIAGEARIANRPRWIQAGRKLVNLHFIRAITIHAPGPISGTWSIIAEFGATSYILANYESEANAVAALELIKAACGIEPLIKFPEGIADENVTD